MAERLEAEVRLLHRIVSALDDNDIGSAGVLLKEYAEMIPS